MGDDSPAVVMTLLNQETPVLRAEYAEDLHAFTRIVELLNPEFAPPALFDGTGAINRRTLNDWWRARAIPASRDQMEGIRERLARMGVDSCLELLERAWGLSLSDRYWVCDERSGLTWADVNFFDNDFSDDLGMLTFDGTSPAEPSLCSPDSSLGGDLRKKWVVRGGVRTLVKSGSGPFLQEPYNEVVATCLFERMLAPGAFVPYELDGAGNCRCPDMLGPDEELVSAWDLVGRRKKPNSLNDWQFLASVFEGSGVADARRRLTEMFVLDLVLANRDRHYRNFGLIRDVRTLAYKRVAPIFDTGGCLWSWARELDVPRDYAYLAKPFGVQGYPFERQLAFFDDFAWFDAGLLDGFDEQATEVLARDRLLSAERVEKVVAQMGRNVEAISTFASAAGRKVRRPRR